MADRDRRDFDAMILDSLGESVFTVDRDWRITSFNRAAEELTGFRRDEAVGRLCHDVFRADACQKACPLRQAIEKNEPQRDVRVTILDSEMEEVPVSASTAVLRDADGEVVGGVEVMRDLSDIEQLRRELEGRHVFEDIVGRSPAMRELFRLLPDVARADVSVLIEGPSGTGKEMVAQALHRLSERAEGPFVRVNCAALPDTLLESELFGYRKGAFTDARRDHPGHFVTASGGTLFLDEIGDTSPAFQAKLLRALQEGEVQPLGAPRPVKVDVRIVSATNRDLAALVAEGAFREDLYYRLRVVPLRIPALRERPEDIPLLAEHLLQRIATARGRSPGRFHPSAMRALMDHDFPGNVRELENLIDRALVIRHGDEIRLEHLPPEVTGPSPAPSPALRERLRRGQRPVVTPDGVDEPEDPEARELLRALADNRWDRGRTAEALGISRTTLWRRMRDLELL